MVGHHRRESCGLEEQRLWSGARDAGGWIVEKRRRHSEEAVDAEDQHRSVRQQDGWIALVAERVQARRAPRDGVGGWIVQREIGGGDEEDPSVAQRERTGDST